MRRFVEMVFCALIATSGGAQDMPNEVARVRDRAIKITINPYGYWEAEIARDLVMIYIPAGKFIMGSQVGQPDERPVHEIHLDGYWLGKHLITVGQFRQFVEDTGYWTDAEKGNGSWQHFDGDWRLRYDGSWKNPYFEQGDTHPVVSVSWNDANAYCAWLSRKTGLRFKLPTEAQWEKGARGTDARRFPWGNTLPDGRKANLADLHFWKKYRHARPAHRDIDDGYTETSPVGTYPAGASPYGLLDMAGNVWEWCYDRYAKDYYTRSPAINPSGPSAGSERVNRGGSWTDRDGRIAGRGHNLRAAERTGDDPASSDDHMGFRLCLDHLER